MEAYSYDLKRLAEGVKPLRVKWFPRLRSTSDHAIRLRRAGKLFAPSVVLTGHQLAGRGRGSNTWWSGPGSITATFVMPVDETCEAYQLPLVAGLAVRNAVAELTGAEMQLKWPNDLLFEGRKLAGLLCERVDKADLIGVGLNVNVAAREVPKGLRERVTSLSQILGREMDLTEVFAAVARGLYRAVAHRGERGFSDVLKEYDRHHALVGRRVTVAMDGEGVSGKCAGLDGMGRLLLKDGVTVHRVVAGQVVAW